MEVQKDVMLNEMLFLISFFQAYMKQGEFDSARDKFKKAQYYEPSDKPVKDALVELDK